MGSENTVGAVPGDQYALLPHADHPQAGPGVGVQAARDSERVSRE